MSTYEELVPRVEDAAYRTYDRRAENNPVLHQYALERAKEIAPAFHKVLEAEFFPYRERVETGIYRLLMDFTDTESGTEDIGIDMPHMHTIVGAFMFLADIYGRDWDKTTREFALLAVSMEIAGKTFDTPTLDRQEARFGFLLSLALDTTTVTGLQRPELSLVDND